MKPLDFLVRDTRVRAFEFPVSRAISSHGVSHASPPLPSPPARCFPREVFHMQAGQCYNQINKKFINIICNEHSIGDGGEYCGDNDAQFVCINVFYHAAIAFSAFSNILLASAMLFAKDLDTHAP
jgi:hypothetical protein